MARSFMLIKNYIRSVLKHPNHTDFLLSQDESDQPQTTISHKNFKSLPSSPLSDFPAVTPIELTELFNEQLNACKKEGAALLQYGYLTKSTFNETVKQYEIFYFHEKSTYIKEELRDYILREYNLSTIHTSKPEQEKTAEERIAEKYGSSDRNVEYISVEAIRKITGYTTTPYLPSKKKSVHIKWQEDFQDLASDPSNREITINGSRQIGKSISLAQLLAESSFIPNYDQAVVAPTQGHTNLIKNYIDKYIEPFKQTDFEFHTQARDNVITNLFSGSKIYFKTLDKEGQAALGLTLKRIVVDEAQLVSVDTVMDSLKPTLLTTEGQIILLGTAIERTSSYMYQSIVASKRGDEGVKVITVSLDDNPLVSDKDRKRIVDDRANPYKKASIERQYYNQWGKNGDSILKPTTFKFESYHKEAPLVIGIDPARKHDRSAYSICEVRDGTIYVLTSGEVPISHKSDWSLQAKFLKEKIESFPHLSKHIVIDGTGVGDGVVDIFRAQGIKITQIIQYTAGSGENHDGDRSKVGKSLMLNRIVDSFQDQRLRMDENMNKLLLDEIDDLSVEQNNFGNLVLKGEGYDDIFNATMLANYYTIKLQLHTRYSSKAVNNTNITFAEEYKIYQHAKPKSQIATGW